MKKIWIVILSIVAVLLIWGATTYNSFVKKQESMTRAWSQVENVYQRRADLVPNLISIVKSYAEYEKGTLIALTEARNKVATAKVNTEDFDENEFSNYVSAQNDLDRVIAVVESYPNLKADTLFLELQAQLNGCENRIITERNRYNEAVATYNKSVLRFPSSLIAKMFGFKERPYFKADKDADKVPETF